jgi:hypothetical protein
MNKFAVAKSMPYYDQVYNSIKQMIHQGVFQPGDRIYEAKIARDYKLRVKGNRKGPCTNKEIFGGQR